MPERTFLKITNRDIFDKLEKMDERLESIELHAKETNGKVKLNRWIATTALTMVVAFIGICGKILFGG